MSHFALFCFACFFFCYCLRRLFSRHVGRGRIPPPARPHYEKGRAGTRVMAAFFWDGNLSERRKSYLCLAMSRGRAPPPAKDIGKPVNGRMQLPTCWITNSGSVDMIEAWVHQIETCLVWTIQWMDLWNGYYRDGESKRWRGEMGRKKKERLMMHLVVGCNVHLVERYANRKFS